MIYLHRWLNALEMNFQSWGVLMFCTQMDGWPFRLITNMWVKCVLFWSWMERCSQRKIQDMLTWTKRTLARNLMRLQAQLFAHALAFWCTLQVIVLIVSTFFDICPPFFKIHWKKTCAFWNAWLAILRAMGIFACLLNWDGRCSGVHHQQYNYDAGEGVLKVFTGSDWASDRQSRRSVSCCLVFYGRCLLYAASRTQKVISLSYAEAEVYACSSGCSDAILLAKLISWLNGKPMHVHLYTDSSGATGILQRMGVGRLRHLSCRILAQGTICIAAVSGHSNPADIGAKRLVCSRMRSLMSVLGIYNLSAQSLEGSDDPGVVFVRRFNIRTLISALSLLQLQGCSSDGPEDEVTWFAAVSAMLLGFLFILPWVFPNVFGAGASVAAVEGQSNEANVDDEVQVDQPVAMDDLQAIAQGSHDSRGPVAAADLIAVVQDMHPVASGSSSSNVGQAGERAPEPATYPERIPTFTRETMPPVGAEWSPEALIVWLYDRCSGRLSWTHALLKQNVYRERMNILRVCLRNGQVTRLDVYDMLVEVDDLSEDENSPNHELSHQGRLSAIRGTQRAFDFGSDLMRSLQVRSYPPASSIHADTVARQLVESFNEVDGEESSVELEDPQQRLEWYVHSYMSKIWDPECLMDIHHGDDDEAGSEAGWHVWLPKPSWSKDRKSKR